MRCVNKRVQHSGTWYLPDLCERLCYAIAMGGVAGPTEPSGFLNTGQSVFSRYCRHVAQDRMESKQHLADDLQSNACGRCAFR